jgi:hypothetical protein
MAAELGSSEHYLKFFESYSREPRDVYQNTPRELGDFRERVPRETVRGRYMFFHENLEMYVYRHWRAYTVPRAAAIWFITYGFLLNGCNAFLKTFPNLGTYKRFSDHPSYKLLGGFWSYFYAIRPFFWAWASYKMARLTYFMIIRHMEGKGDPHYWWFYDTLYPDMIHDEEDMRYINFRYTDQKVVPDPITAYYPYEDLKYNHFLTKSTPNA